MRTIMIAGMVLTLALSGCDSGGNYSSGGNADSDATATMMLLGGTAFLNGYNQARPPAPLFTTCTQYGCITQ